MSASVDAIEPIAPLKSEPLQSALIVQIIGSRRLSAAELGCAHDRLVFDDINDVHCAHCGEDFTD